MQGRGARTTGWRSVRGGAPGAVALASLAGLAAAALAPLAGAQVTAGSAGESARVASATADSPNAGIDPRTLDGRGFGGVRLPLAARQGELRFEAQRAQSWSEGPTRRLLLTGRVRIRIDTVEFNCERALVWLEHRRTLADGSHEYQLFLYLDDAKLASDAPLDEPSTMQLEGKRLPVRSVIAVPGGPVLRLDEVVDGPPLARGGDAEFLGAGQEAFASSLRRLIPGYVETPDDPFQRLPVPAPVQPSGLEVGPDAVPLQPFDAVAEAEKIFAASPVAAVSEPIFARSGVITLAAGKVTLVSGKAQDGGEGENTVMATNGVVLEYTDTRRGVPRTLQVRAQRAVVFLAGKQSDLTRFGAQDVRGFYLEGDATATDGQYTLRGPRIFYDMARNKAVVIDAVFWTYDERRQLPLYVRAKAIRQEAVDQFSAEGARLSNSAFLDPELSVGASSVTISRVKREPTEEERLAGAVTTEQTLVDARDITLRAMGVPFLYWPRFVGDPSDQPIRDIRIENQAGSGTTFRTRLGLYQLLGIEGPSNTSLDLIADASTERGAGVGSRFEWDKTNTKGELFAYALPDDRGTDILPSGARIERDGEFRGILTGETRWKVNERWTAFLEGAYLGDENVVAALFPRLAAERREFTTRALGRRLEDNSALFVEASGNLNDFVANEYLLTSKGYSVTRLPEASYHRQADDLVPELPGLLSWWSEYRVGRLALNFDEITSANRGFPDDFRALRGLGITAAQSPGDRLRAAGLDEEGVFRADTRQEVTMQLGTGPLNLQPFAIGRATFYDNDYEAYAPNAGVGNDETRLWSAAGARASTQIQRVYNGVDSRLLDIHRLRHIVEPGVTYMVAGTNVESSSLPVFDDEVENLLDGQIVRLGVDQTWQTQRGGPGRWHSVDVFKLKTEVVLSSDDATIKGPIGRWYEARPELSWAGDFFSAEGTWQVTDTLAITGRDIFSFDTDTQALTGGGLLIRHSPEFSSFLDAHYVNSQDQTIIGAGTQYQLTDKYLLSTYGTFDAEREGFQGASFDLRRRFESVTIGASVSYDEVSGTTSFGFSIQPTGTRSGASLGGFGGASPTSRVGG